jgi:hypothetical protein
MKGKRWMMRIGWIVLALWLASSIGQNCAPDEQFKIAVAVLVCELLLLGMVEMVCQAIREGRGE